MSWDDGRIERLKKLWSDGLSASQIAAELGGVTRNAVIGKCIASAFQAGEIEARHGRPSAVKQAVKASAHPRGHHARQSRGDRDG